MLHPLRQRDLGRRHRRPAARSRTSPLHNPEPASVVDGPAVPLRRALDVEQRRGVVRELPHLRRPRQPGLGPRQSRRRRCCHNPNPFRVPDPLGTSFPDFHPMKGPMTTQSLRGMANHGPMHWRGDRTGGNDPGGSALDEDAAFKQVQRRVRRACSAATAPLADGRDAGVHRLHPAGRRYPPNPIRNLDNSLDRRPGRRAATSTSAAHRRTSSRPATAATCSIRRTGFFGTDGVVELRERDADRSRSRTCATCTRRSACSACRRSPFINAGDNGHKGDQIRGFGFLHDGSVDTLFRFFTARRSSTSASGRCINAGGFPTGAAGDAKRRQVEQFMLAFDTQPRADRRPADHAHEHERRATSGTRIDLLIARREHVDVLGGT